MFKGVIPTKVVLFAATSIFISSCGLTTNQKSAALQIGNATSTAGQFSSDSFIGIRQAVIDMQVAYYRIDHEASCIKMPNRTCSLPLDRGLSTDDMAARIALADAITAYGNAINALVSEDRDQAIAEAANELSGSIASATEKNDSIDFDQDKQEAVSTLTQLASGWYVERKREQGLKKIAKAYSKLLEQAIPLLKQDFDIHWNSPCRTEFKDGRSKDAPTSGKDRPSGVLDVYCETAYKLKSFAKRRINDSSFPHYQRRDSVDAYVLAENAQNNGWIISQKGTKLLAQLLESSHELKNIVNDPDYKIEDLKRLAKNTKELSSSLKLLITE